MILDKIVNAKKIRLEEIKKLKSLEEVKEEASHKENSLSFYKALKKDGLSIIGEVKKASPSKGIIREHFEPLSIAKEYENTVDAISILTEEEFFLGKPEYLQFISANISIPCLRKDFIIDEYQIYEAKVLGASAILLIVAILTEEELRTFIKLAKDLGMDSLVEVHSREELEIALRVEAEIIGINNRDLRDFSISLDTTIELAKLIPENKIIVSESGIDSIDDIKYLKKSGISAILVGESFMRTGSIEEKAKDFKKAFK